MAQTLLMKVRSLILTLTVVMLLVPLSAGPAAAMRNGPFDVYQAPGSDTPTNCVEGFRLYPSLVGNVGYELQLDPCVAYSEAHNS